MISLPASRIRLRTVLVRTALVAGLSLAAAGCGEEGAPVSGTDASASESPAESPSETPSESASPSPSASATTSTAPTLVPAPTGPGPQETAALLTAAEVPGLNENTRWQAVGTTAETTPVGTCQRATLTSLGARSTAVRRYESPGTATSAIQVVATYADEAAARRAWDTVLAWRTSCAEKLQAAVEKISPFDAVPAPAGQAGHYLAQFGARDTQMGEFDGVAVVRVGARLSIVQIDTAGQDYNYLPGEEPAAFAAKAAAAKLA